MLTAPFTPPLAEDTGSGGEQPPAASQLWCARQECITANARIVFLAARLASGCFNCSSVLALDRHNPIITMCPLCYRLAAGDIASAARHHVNGA